MTLICIRPCFRSSESVTTIISVDGLQQSYLGKARDTDRNHNNIPPGTVGPVEQKLISLGEVRGMVRSERILIPCWPPLPPAG